MNQQAINDFMAVEKMRAQEREAMERLVNKCGNRELNILTAPDMILDVSIGYPGCVEVHSDQKKAFFIFRLSDCEIVA